MKEYLNFFEARCPRSKAAAAAAAKHIPGGIQHNLAFNYPFPLNIAKAESAEQKALSPDLNRAEGA